MGVAADRYSVCIFHFVQYLITLRLDLKCLPLVVNRLDDEAERRADFIDILVHNLPDDGSLACVVQATTFNSANHLTQPPRRTHSIRILISLSFRRAFLKIESILGNFVFLAQD